MCMWGVGRRDRTSTRSVLESGHGAVLSHCRCHGWMTSGEGGQWAFSLRKHLHVRWPPRSERDVPSSFQKPGCASCWQCSEQGNRGQTGCVADGFMLMHSAWTVYSPLYLSLSLSLSPALFLLCVHTDHCGAVRRNATQAALPSPAARCPPSPLCREGLGLGMSVMVV